jgi:tetratricopeptide (TPR) repeat protein
MDRQAQCPNPTCGGNPVQPKTIVFVADPDRDAMSRLLAHLPFSEAKGTSAWLFAATALVLFAIAGWSLVWTFTSPFPWQIGAGALAVFAIFLALLSLANLYVVLAYSDADKVKIHMYRCRRCGYKWADHDPPHEPHIKRLQWAVARSRKSPNRRFLAAFLSDLGAMQLMNGDSPQLEAMAYLDEALAIRRELGDKKISYTLNNLAFALYCMDRSGEARGYAEESLALLREQKDWKGSASTLNTLGHILLDQGEAGRAVACFEESLPLAHRMRDMESIAWNLEGLAAVAATHEQGGRAARLLGAAQALREANRWPLIPSARRRYEGVVEAARAQVGDTDFGAAWTQGTLMPLEQVVTYALDRRGDFTLSIPTASFYR